MSDFAAELARLMAARSLGVRELARMAPCNPGHISNLRSGKARPSAELAEALDERLEAGGTLRALAPTRPPGRHQLAPARDDSAIADEIAALDLVRQAEASQSAAARSSGWTWLWTTWPWPTRAPRPPSCWTGCAAISATSVGCSTPNDAG